MKKLDKKQILKYFYLHIADLVFILCLVFLRVIPNINDVGENEYFSMVDVIVVLSVPIYVFLRGCFSYVLLKQIWVPNLILFGVIYAVYFASEMVYDGGIDFSFLMDSMSYIFYTAFFLVLLTGSTIAASILLACKKVNISFRKIANSWVGFVTAAQLGFVIVGHIESRQIPRISAFFGVVFLLFVLFLINVDPIVERFNNSKPEEENLPKTESEN